MKVLHFAPDEKYIPFARDVFREAFPGANRFRVTRSRKGGGFVDEAEDTRKVGSGYWFSTQLQRDLEWAECLVVHFLSRRFARALAGAPPGLLIAWHGWGKDYYSLLDGYSDRLYLPLTSEYLATERRRARHGLPDPTSLRSRLVGLLDDVLYHGAIEKALSRVDVVSMLPSEFELLKRSRPQVRAVFHQLYYSSVETSFAPGPERMQGPDLLLGNSASPTNNHLEAFRALARHDLAGRRLLVPLSYGEKDYADHVEREGYRLFGDSFVPLRDFLPISEYNARIANCGFVFMNHVRQQATGNVSIALLKGAKVFLRQENLLAPFYRNMGASLCDFPDESGTPDASLFEPLGAEERERNRRAVMNYWDRATIVQAARNLETLRGTR